MNIKNVVFAPSVSGKIVAILQVRYCKTARIIFSLFVLLVLSTNFSLYSNTTEEKCLDIVNPCNTIPDRLIQLTIINNEKVIQDVCDCEPYEVVHKDSLLILQGGCDASVFDIVSCKMHDNDKLGLSVLSSCNNQLDFLLEKVSAEEKIWFIKTPGWSSYDSLYYIESKVKDSIRVIPAECD
ncbi:hypothetical protein QA601_18575 [Chitinispirillales bacterium ANBcel5]|uniref:hypothetical protein n=1 Tax=Cellulosispirillum alkaliphilum TaxID=3039283 RepID=UPI002A50CCFB|nr:hypothetical protein [Chitinispirillales bacterium ANBcel5]